MSTSLKVGEKIKTPVLDKGQTAYKIITLENYSSGAPHGGIDLGAPTGTEVRAPMAGTVVALHDGVANNKPGSNPGSGAPSNWVQLLVRMETNFGQTQDATLLFQHLSPGVKVKVNQKVKAGDLLGHSGNTGNSTGPHLHMGGQWVRPSQGHGPDTRYDHVNKPDLRIWGPERYLDIEEDTVAPEPYIMIKRAKNQTIPLNTWVKLDIDDANDWVLPPVGADDWDSYVNLDFKTLKGAKRNDLRYILGRWARHDASSDDLTSMGGTKVDVTGADTKAIPPDLPVRYWRSTWSHGFKGQAKVPVSFWVYIGSMKDGSVVSPLRIFKVDDET